MTVGVPNEPSAALCERARGLLEAGDYRAAHAACIEVIRRDVRCAEAYFLLALIAVEHDNIAKAADVLGRAIEHDPNVARYHAELARCLVLTQRWEEARVTSAQALALAPKSARTWDTLGVTLTRFGDHARALECFEEAVRRQPQSAAYQYNRASAYQFAGLFEEADTGYRAVLRREPDHFRAWSALSQLWRSGGSEQDVAELEQAWDRLSADREARLHIGHALARHHEQTGDPVQSMAWLQRAKRLQRDAVRYDVSRDRAVADAAQELWRRGLPSSAGEPRGDRALFVVGMPRTGTTLVDRILSSHPEVTSAGELGEFSLAVKRLTGTSSRRVMDAETLNAAADVDTAQLADEYLSEVTRRVGEQGRFVDKMPFNFFYAGLIVRALPNARIVCLRRHPMDVALSNYRQLFSARPGYYEYAYDLDDTARFYAVFDALARFWAEALPPDRYLELRYEDLVDDQERETRRLLDFCGLTWSDACLRFTDNRAPVATASSVQVRRPLHRDAVDRWRRYGDLLDPVLERLRLEGVAV